MPTLILILVYFHPIPLVFLVIGPFPLILAFHAIHPQQIILNFDILFHPVLFRLQSH